MKKSNKISVFYFLSSIFLLLFLIFGGVYGIYISVGLNFIKGNTVNVMDSVDRASNVSFGGSVNFESSMSGIIILSIVLVVLAVFDIVTLFKQIIFFKQFNVVKESTIEQVIERKIKSKKSVIVFTIIIDLLSLVAGIVGIFLNMRTFVGVNNVWLLYIVDCFVVLFSLMSIVLLILKLKKLKNKNLSAKQNHVLGDKFKYVNAINGDVRNENYTDGESEFDIDKIEYSLLKLKYLKSCKIIDTNEFEHLREKILDIKYNSHPKEK